MHERIYVQYNKRTIYDMVYADTAMPRSLESRESFFEICPSSHHPSITPPARVYLPLSSLHYSLYHLQLLLQQTLHPPLHRVQIFRRRNIILPPHLPTRERQILRHNPIDINRVNACLLQTLGKRHDFRRPVQRPALYEASRPREDGGDWVRGRLVAFLVLSVVARYGAVGSFGFECLAVRGYEDGGHEAEGAEALGDDVGEDVAVIVFRFVLLVTWF